MDRPRLKIALFLILTLALSAIGWIAPLQAGAMHGGNGNYVAFVMWCPGIAAILTRLITQRNLRGMGWKPGKPSYLALAYALPVLYALPVYGIAWQTGLGGFDPHAWVGAGPMSTPWGGLLLLASVGVLGSLTTATGEEIGWRGLLVPELAKVTSFRNTALMSGAIWAAWHAPLIISAGYRGQGTPLAYSMACFAGMVVAMAFVMAWIRLRSGGFWPAALLHASHNLFVQAVFDTATVKTNATEWVTGEFGIGLVVTVAIAALVICRREPTPALAQ